jgi:molybdate transport system ATP-binding protein
MSFLAVDYRLSTPIELRAKFEIHGFTALLGRSGAGKTSLLKALAGLLPASGAPWEGLAPEAREIGYLPQNAGLFPHLNVLENTAYPLRGANRFALAQTLLAELGLGDLATRGAASLSGGQTQRVALARALARGAKLLLLDEPSAALDAITRDSALAWLITTVTARQIPTLAATHDPAIAGLADWLVLLSAGRIIQQGTPRDVLNHPTSAAAAELLGFENIWTDPTGTNAIRAADITLAETGLPATVISAREHGANLRLECAAPHPIVFYVKAGDRAYFPPGAPLNLQFAPGALKKLG